jgi:tetratricopeptide (TPR) repeat protein
MNEYTVWNEFGNIYMKLGACDEAVAMYRRAIEAAPQSGWAYSNMAAACSQQGRFGEAASLYQKALELLKQDSERYMLWNRLGDVYRRLNDYGKAMAAYQRADELEASLGGTSQPAETSAQPSAQASEQNNWLRDMLTSNSSARMPALGEDAQVERPASAEWVPEAELPVIETPASEKPALAEAPAAPQSDSHPLEKHAADETRPTAARPSGRILDVEPPAPTPAPQPAPESNSFEKSVNVYRRITDINPTNDRAWDTLGLSLKSLGRYDEAVAAFEKAISLIPDREVYYYHLGLVYAAQKQHSAAVEAFRKVISLNADYILAHGALAGSCRRLGLDEEAARHIAIALPHMQTENEYNRACFEAICGNTSQAIELLAAALEKKQTTLEWMRTDPDLDFIREEPRFNELICQEMALV